VNRRETGARKEELAASYLTERGMRITERNFRNRQGEIDIVGWHGGCLVFVEVKYRKSFGAGNAMEAVDFRKQRRICRVADYYRYIHHLGEDTPVRYDVVAIQGEELQWVQNAFPHVFA